jgi:hypothetical protein
MAIHERWRKRELKRQRAAFRTHRAESAKTLTSDERIKGPAADSVLKDAYFGEFLNSR